MPPPSDELREFYEAGYSAEGERGELYERWRALSARGKVDHALTLLAAPDASGLALLEVGCGDGALLAELRARRPAWRLAGVEIAAAPAGLAAARNPGADVRVYDGATLPHGDGSFDVGLLSHVLEHVPDPVAVLAETARVCRRVVLEVPLEDNLSGRRRSRAALASAAGHLDPLSRAEVGRIIDAAGLRRLRELTDALPREVHRFFARTPAQELRADVRWLARAGLHRVAPRAAGRLVTLHYAVLCGPGTE